MASLREQVGEAMYSARWAGHRERLDTWHDDADTRANYYLMADEAIRAVVDAAVTAALGQQCTDIPDCPEAWCVAVRAVVGALRRISSESSE